MFICQVNIGFMHRLLMSITRQYTKCLTFDINKTREQRERAEQLLVQVGISALLSSSFGG